MGLVSNKLRASAKGQQCTFQIARVCNHDSSTTVLCHLRSDIKGLSNKSDDFHAAFGCSACHEAIDNHRLTMLDELFYSIRALSRTQHVWLECGLISIAGDTGKVRPGKPAKLPSKTIPRRPMTRPFDKTRPSQENGCD